MANVKPNVSSSMALIPVGHPLVSMPGSGVAGNNGTAESNALIDKTAPAVTVHKTALTQSGNIAKSSM